MKYKYKVILIVTIIFFVLINTKVRAQEDSLRADSTLSNLYYEVGFGFSNLGEMVVLGIDEKQIFPEHDNFSISFSQQLKSDRYLRIGIVFGYYKEQIIVGNNNFIDPFVATIGLEKKKAKNRWVFSYGTDIYYATLLKRTNIGGVFWQAQQHAFGVAGVIGSSYFIHNNLSVRSEVEVGAGARNSFKTKGFVTQQILTPEIRLIQALSLVLRYHF